MEKEYISDYDVRLATLAKMGGDTSKKYASVYDIDIEILKLTGQGGGGSGEGTTPAQVREIVEGYNYTTMTAVEAKGYLTEHQSLAGYATENFVTSQGYLTEVPAIYAKVVMLTQAEYDALSTKDDHTLYIITDAQ